MKIYIICTLLLNNIFLTSESRIIGGAEVKKRSEFAYQALLLYNGMPYCGGTIIDEKHILTAAHCSVTSNADEVFVVVGNLNLTDTSITKHVEEIFIHENYSPETYVNDISLWRILGSFENTTEDIEPISLQTERIVDGTCNVSGWGTTTDGVTEPSSKLLFVEVPIVPREICNINYTMVTDLQICAGSEGKDSCQGDSGGPLVCSGRLTGIVSYGYKCGVKKFPGVYTEVVNYLQWIEEKKLKSLGSPRSIMPVLCIVTATTIIKLFQ